MIRTLDRKRPFGTIYGDTNGGVYEQGGCVFDGAGNCVSEGADAAPEKTGNGQDENKSDNTSRREKLETLHAAVLKKLVEDMGMEPAVGAGAKAENIEIIIAADG